MWHLRHSNPPRQEEWGRFEAARLEYGHLRRGSGQHMNQAGSHKPDISLKITNGS